MLVTDKPSVLYIGIKERDTPRHLCFAPQTRRLPDSLKRSVPSLTRDKREHTFTSMHYKSSSVPIFQGPHDKDMGRAVMSAII